MVLSSDSLLQWRRRRYRGQYLNDARYILYCDNLSSLVILANLVKHVCSRREVIRQLGFLASPIAPGKMSEYSRLQASFALAGKEHMKCPHNASDYWLQDSICCRRR